MEPISHPLTRFRELAGISVADFAKQVGTTRQSIFRIEKWEQTPSLGLVSKMCAATNGTLKASDFISAHEAAA